MKGIRPGSEGNTRLEKSFGGDGPPRSHYASGGTVKARIFKAFGGGLAGGPSPDALGSPAKKSLGRKGRKASKGDGGIKITNITMPGAGGAGPVGPHNIMPPPGPMAMAPRPPVPPMPPPGAAGPPPPPPVGPAPGAPIPPRVAKFGGRIKAFFRGGTVKGIGGNIGKPKGKGHMITGEAHADGSPKPRYADKGFLKGDGDQFSNTSTAPMNRDTPKGGTKNVVRGAYDKWNYKEQTSNTAENNRLPPAPKYRIADHNELKEDRGTDTTNQKLKHGGIVHHGHHDHGEHHGHRHHHHGGSTHKEHDGHHGHHHAEHGDGKHHVSHHSKAHHMEVHHHHHKKGGHVHKHDGGKVHPEHELRGGGVEDASSEGDHFDILNETGKGKHHHRDHKRYGGKTGGRMSEHHDPYPAKYGGATSSPNQMWHDGVLEASHEDGHEKDVHLHERHGGVAHHHKHGGRVDDRNPKAAGGRVPQTDADGAKRALAENTKGMIFDGKNAGASKDGKLHYEAGAGNMIGRAEKIDRYGR